MRMPRIKAKVGSHLPVLMQAVALTQGPIVEFGSGLFSTPFLHWACFPTNRKLITYENSETWIQIARNFATDFHEVVLVTNWDALDLSTPWGVAFIDHDVEVGRRGKEFLRVTHAEYVVIHDSERRVERTYKYSEGYSKYKYRYDYTDTLPHTSVLSNIHDLSNFKVGS